MDPRIKAYRKAKWKTVFRIFWQLIVMVGIWVGCFFLFKNPYLIGHDGPFEKWFNLYLLMDFLFIIAPFILLLTGKRIARTLYWLWLILKIALVWFPVLGILQGTHYLLTYLVWLGFCLVEDGLLLSFGLQYHTLDAPRIYFGMDIAHPIEQEEIQESRLSLLKAGLILYGSLMLFPMCIPLLSFLFISLDDQAIFGLKEMFGVAIWSSILFSIALLAKQYEPEKLNQSRHWILVGESLSFVVSLLLLWMNLTHYGWMPIISWFCLNMIRLVPLFYLYRRLD